MMKMRMALLFALGFAVLALNAGRRVAADDETWQARDEMHQTYELAPGSAVSVSGINGPVEISTSPGASADLQIIRTGRTQEDLLHRKVTVDVTGSSLVIKGESDHGDWRVRQHVILRLPSNVKLDVHGVNGPVNIGQIEGPVRVSGVNGKVNIDGAADYSTITGVNGHISVTMSTLGDQGLRLSGINGGIEIRVPASMNANLTVTGINGAVYSDLSNMTIQGKWGPREFRAQIGAGGPPVSINGVNGQITIHGN